MPYKGNDDLPKAVQSVLPATAQTIWRNAFNNAYDSQNLSDNESLKVAWAAVGKTYRKGPKGLWVLKKQSPTLSQVHVPTTNREKQEKAKSYKPNGSMQSAARSGLELRRKWKRGGLSNSEASAQGIKSGVQRASDIANGENLSLESVRAMNRFFSRHAKNYRPDKKENDGGPTAGTIAWKLWGGSSGQSWARGILKREGLLKEEMYETTSDLLKAGKPLGVIFGWPITCEMNGKEYHDTDGDYIPEDVMLKGSLQFMKGERVVNVGHTDTDVGQMIFAFPLTKEIAKAMGVKTNQFGLMAGAKVNKKTFQKFEDGELTGFSIEGSYSAKDL